MQGLKAFQISLLLYLAVAHLEVDSRPSSLRHFKREQNESDDGSSAIAEYLLVPTRIPGLYDQTRDPLITPIQGRAQFEELVLRANKQVARQPRKPTNDREQSVVNMTINDNENDVHFDPRDQKFSLVQFYMATCPDCQGFAPYFRRFVWDVGSHWRHLVRIFVVNCNDDLNINLCWSENPTLIVPLVRWYTFPVLLNNPKRYDFPVDLLNVSHRQYIEHQRRDLISLRHATLRFMGSTLSHLSKSHSKIRSFTSMETKPRYKSARDEFNDTQTNVNSSLSFYNALPMRWKLFSRLDERESGASKFVEELGGRIEACASALGQADGVTIENFIVFETRKSFIGRTLVADWSNWTCAHSDLMHSRRRALILHYTTNLPLLRKISIEAREKGSQTSKRDLDFLIDSSHPIVFAFSSKAGDRIEKLDDIKLKLISWNHTEPQDDRLIVKRESGSSRDLLAEPIGNRKRQQPRDHYLNLHHHHHHEHADHRRHRRDKSFKSINATDLFENSNFLPEEVYRNEERLRYEFNERISRVVFGDDARGIVIPGEKSGKLSKIDISLSVDRNRIVDPKIEDTSLVTMTDYYKSLAETVDKTLVSKGELDGFKIAASACFVKKLARLFPFQGATEGSRSMARHYLELVHRSFADTMRDSLESSSLKIKPHFSCEAKSNIANANHEAEYSRKFASGDDVSKFRESIEKRYFVGLPSTSQLNYSYCRGSSEYLRGYTCSLWILFHTLTVEELTMDYNITTRSSSSADHHSRHHHLRQGDHHGSHNNPPEAYKFVINFTKPAANSSHMKPYICDTENPEKAYLGANSSDLFVDAPQFVLANIINFVRFYLPCTNCAAHFSCMVGHSDLNFDNPAPGDHLLWMWEAHNRVNLRTRKTHSEDPTHPKHLFPTYEACEKCYLEKPKVETVTTAREFEQIKFNRKELIGFLVARYKRSAILNNKIRIEDLFRRKYDQSRS